MYLIYTPIYVGFKVRCKAESRLNLNCPYHLCEIFVRFMIGFKSLRKHLSLNLAEIFWEHYMRGASLESYLKSNINQIINQTFTHN